MKVTLFKNLKSAKWSSPSMERYAFNLERELKLLGVEVKSMQPSMPWLFSLLPSKINFYLSRFIYYPLLASFNQSEINHITDHSFAQLIFSLNRKKTVITCHDLIPLRVEKDPFALEMFNNSISGLAQATWVMADSEETKKELVEKLGISGGKIKVVYLGIEEKFQPLKEREVTLVREKYNLPKGDILLHVGNNLPYKNIERILSSLKMLQEKKKDFTFLKIGPDFTPEQKAIIEDSGLSEKIIRLNNVTEEDLIGLYNLARMLIYPSLFEGFGFPVLEAMACGLPVIVSKEGSLEEIAGEAGIYVDSGKVENITQAIEELLENASQREKHSEKGLQQAKKFNWKKTAEQVLEVYRSIK